MRREERGGIAESGEGGEKGVGGPGVGVDGVKSLASSLLQSSVGISALLERESGKYQIVRQLAFTGHGGRVNRCAFSGTGCSLASASDDATVRIHTLPGVGTHANPSLDRNATI